MKHINLLKKFNKKWIFPIILLLVVLVFHTWFYESIWQYDNHTVSWPHFLRLDQNMEDGVTYTQSFYNWAIDPERISVELTNCDAVYGKCTLWLYDDNGKCVKKKKKTIKPYAFPIYIHCNVASKNLQVGKKYTVKMKFQSIEGDATPTISCHRALSPLNRMWKGKNKISAKMQFTYRCDRYIPLWIIPVLLLLLAVMWLLRKKEPVKQMNIWLATEIFAIVTTFTGYCFIEGISGQLDNLSFWNLFSNGCVIIAVFMALMLLLGNPKLVSLIVNGICIFIGTANYYTLLFREKPILSWDLLAIKTATAVVGQYHFRGYYAVVIAILIWVVMFLLLRRVDVKERKTVAIRVICLLQGVLFVGCFVKFALPKADTNIWYIVSNYENQGVITSFFAYAKEVKYKKPENYTEDNCEKLLEAVETVPAASSVRATNVIVIMNESLADFRLLGGNAIEGDYMPNIDALQENIIKGSLYMPVFGALTCNSEFEALSGVSCAYVPGTPFQMYVTKPMDSLTSFMKNQGYCADAFHPNKGINWNRNTVYRNFGFDNFYTIDDKDPNLIQEIHEYMSDSSDYKHVIKFYEEHGSGPYYMFNVTMQNHGGYGNDDDISVDLSQYGNFPMAENYLSLVKESDKAFQELIDYFSKVDEPTIICMFGDHQPSIEPDFYATIFGKPLEQLSQEENMRRYVTPFYIWTNYDIEEQTIDAMSANYLSSLVLKYAGFELTGYEAFLDQLYKQYPVLSVNGVYDKDGNFYSSVNDINDQMLVDYRDLQYYRMRH